MASVTAMDIRAIVDCRLAQPSTGTHAKQGRVAMNRLLARLSQFFRWCLDHGYVTNSPFLPQPGRPPVRMLRGAEQSRSRRMLPGEEARLLVAANPHLYAVIITLLDTGLRIGEVLNLQFRDVDASRNVLTVRAETAKTSEAREVPMTERVAAIIDMRRLAPDGFPYPPEAYVFGDK